MSFDAALLEAQAGLAWAEERRLLEELGLAGSVLEVGCGTGALAARLAGLPAVERVTGVDADAELLALARERLPGGEFVEAAAEALPFPDAGFDAALVRLVLQHVADPVAVVRELARVVRAGGLVVAIDVDGGFWGLSQPYLPELAEVQAKVWRGSSNRMIGRRLHRILAAAGLADVSLRPYAYHSDALGLDAFAPLLAPEAMTPALEEGRITLADYQRLVAGYARFRADPDAFVLLAGLLAAGRVPSRP